MVAGALQADHIETNVIIATAFAAPLIQMLPIEGAMLSAVSRASGTGKTLSLQLAQAVWGDPRAMFSLTDTPASMFKRLGLLNNLPAYWDEVRVGADQRLKRQHVDLLYQTTIGREKARMKQNTQLHDTETWSTLIVCTSNEGVREHIQEIDRGMTAGINRVLEFTVGKLDSDKKCPASEFVQVTDHSGHAGVEYATWLIANREEVEKSLVDTLHKLEAKLNATAEQRFLVATITAVVMGAMFAKKAGIVDLDAGAILHFLRGAFDEQAVLSQEISEENVNSEFSPISLVSEFLTVNQPKIAVIQNRMQPGLQLDSRNILSVPDDRTNTVAVLSRDGELVIPKAMLRDYARAKGVTSFNALMKQIPGIVEIQRLFPRLETTGIPPTKPRCYVITKLPGTEALFT